MSDDALRYGSAGVDIDVSNAAKQRIRNLVESTITSGVVGGFGGFGGAGGCAGGASDCATMASGMATASRIVITIAVRVWVIQNSLVNLLLDAQGAPCAYQ